MSDDPTPRDAPAVELPGVTVWHGDCIDVLRGIPDNSIDAIVTDPPYGLEFMGKDWDSFAPRDRKNASVWDGRRQGQEGWQEHAATQSGKGGAGPSYRSSHKGSKRCTLCGRRQFSGTPCTCPNPSWELVHRQEAPAAMLGFQAWCTEWSREAYRVLKPGGHMLAFGGTRTWHRLACAVEDAGFEIRDSIAWLYGSGFPKSLDVGKAIDKRRTEDRAPVDAVRAWLNARRLAAGVTHDTVNKHFGHASNGGGSSSAWMTNPTSRSLPTWDQWQQLKGLLGFGDDMDAEVWRLNGRKGQPGDAWESREVIATRAGSIGKGNWREMENRSDRMPDVFNETAPATDAARQWDGWGTALKPAFEPVVVARKPLAGTVAANVTTWGTGGLNIDACRVPGEVPSVPQPVLNGESGHAMSSTPAGRWPANVALDGTQSAVVGEPARFFPTFRYQAKAPTRERPFYVKDGAPTDAGKVAHPTVKPVELMRWLVRLVTPPGGTVLDPFAGSGTTLEAARLEGFTAVGIERETDYLPLIVQRLTRGTPTPEVVDDVELEQPAARPSIVGDQPGLFDLMPGSDND